MPLSDAQKKAQKKYRTRKDVKEKNAKNQKESFANIAATFAKPEKEQIAATFRAHGVTPAQVIRAGWYALNTDPAAAELIRANAATAAEMHRAQTAERQPGQRLSPATPPP